jgi:tripartite-type tricarboxylate transporter receptor subunit TctC
MKLSRRRFLHLIAGAAFSPVVSRSARAQSDYPERAIRIIVGFAPAGPADITARLIGEELAKDTGQPVIIENISGAAGNLAGARVANAAPDGYTLLMAGTNQITTNPSLYVKMPYDPLGQLAPISEAVVTPNILAVNNDVPATTLQELVSLARAKPGSLTFGSAGIGTSQHLAGELFKSLARLDIQHVPYRGAAPVITDLLAGRISMFFGNISTVLPMTRAAKLRGLAVTSPERFPLTPELPTMAESGFPGFDVTVGFGLMAPIKTPRAIIDRLHHETVRIMALPAVRNRIDELGMKAVANSPEKFGAALKAEAPQWAKLIKEIGLRASD